MRYNVVGTAREKNCDQKSDIIALVLDRKYINGEVEMLQTLKHLADSHLLWVKVGPQWACKEVRVEIYFSPHFNRWIARTTADSVQCDNLKALPVYGVSNRAQAMTYYNVCEL